MERCNKLCSGDYITSFASTLFQIATYKMLKEIVEVKDYLCGGDDAAICFGQIKIDKAKQLFKNTKSNNAMHNILNNIIKKNITNSDGINQMIQLFFKEFTGDDIQLTKSYLDVVAYNRRI